MRKNIKNYCSEVSMSRSLSLIQKMLASKGAEKMMIDYKDGEPVSFTFAIQTSKGLMPIMLPARIERVARVMYGANLQQLTQVQLKQTKRTAWKNIHDWIDAQLALIETEMVKMEEIFLPYIVINGTTVFNKFESGTLLTSGRTGGGAGNRSDDPTTEE